MNRYKAGDRFFTPYYNIVAEDVKKLKVGDIVEIDYPEQLKVQIETLRLGGISCVVVGEADDNLSR